jgi:hypothetical protein
MMVDKQGPIVLSACHIGPSVSHWFQRGWLIYRTPLLFHRSQGGMVAVELRTRRVQSLAASHVFVPIKVAASDS